MTENPKMERIMGSDNLKSSWEAEEQISVSNELNGLQQSSAKSDSFLLDMERFSQVLEKDINASSRITLQRNLSRKGSIRDAGMLSISPRVTLHGGISTPEKPVVVPLGATADHALALPQVHQITITNGSMSTAAATENKIGGKRCSFPRTSPSSTFDPRRILFFFATLSSLGTILLIYFTISMGKLSGDDNALN